MYSGDLRIFLAEVGIRMDNKQIASDLFVVLLLNWL